MLMGIWSGAIMNKVAMNIHIYIMSYIHICVCIYIYIHIYIYVCVCIIGYKHSFLLCKPYRRRQWHPTPVLLPGKSHGWRSLVVSSPWCR